MRIVAAVALLCASLPAGAGPAQLCIEHHTELTPAPSPRALAFGVTAAGRVFTQLPERVPDDPAATMAALDELRAASPFLVRLNRFFAADGADGIDRFAEQAERFTLAGYQVTLQLRYGPGAPSPDEFVAWVRAVVARLGPNPGVVALEVTNEPNLKTAPDNSDGAHAGVIEALAHGVIAAAAERDARALAHLRIGFNWFHDTGPLNERGFWNALARAGGAPFAAALDWVGLNTYPGTYDFLATPPGLEGNEVLDALVKLRRCYLPIIGAPDSTPIRVIENGFPDGAGRPEPVMADALERMVRAVHEHAGTYNVTHYLWFTLRDVNSGSVSFEARYGLLRDDYAPKQAFGRYRDLVAVLG